MKIHTREKIKTNPALAGHARTVNNPAIGLTQQGGIKIIIIT